MVARNLERKWNTWWILIVVIQGQDFLQFNAFPTELFWPCLKGQNILTTATFAQKSWWLTALCIICKRCATCTWIPKNIISFRRIWYILGLKELVIY